MKQRERERDDVLEAPGEVGGARGAPGDGGEGEGAQPRMEVAVRIRVGHPGVATIHLPEQVLHGFLCLSSALSSSPSTDPLMVGLGTDLTHETSRGRRPPGCAAPPPQAGGGPT